MRRWVAVIALVQVFYAARARNIIGAFAIKGGYALELRLRSRARASRDVDMVLEPNRDQLADAVVEALRETWSEFTFGVKSGPEYREHSIRFEINARYRDREWSTFVLEVVEGEITEEDIVAPLDLQEFGLLRAESIPCINMSVQVAQKLHAVTDPSEDRARDLLDIFIIISTFECDDGAIKAAIVDVFNERKTHAWPTPIEMRDGWATQILETIKRDGFDFTLDQVLRGVRAFVLRLVGTD
ncbi:MAG: nucleotidyl transferase AbiEii/AbiGii toxin family protein [Candidatus Eremiobacteraeota bacterium]|nr:nucleotidyl transferase AbiEii/AbiGii toxin family protein [Candidatus Eremiobacteraeota bacterium]